MVRASGGRRRRELCSMLGFPTRGGVTIRVGKKRVGSKLRS